MKLDALKLKLAMAERGFTCSLLSEKSGVSMNNINLILNHQRTPRLDTLGKIAKALGVPVMDLVKEA